MRPTTRSNCAASPGNTANAPCWLGERILLIEAGRIALDQPVPLARPRARASAGFAALEAHVLQRVLKSAPDDDALPHRPFDARDEGRLSWPTDVRWAV